MGGTRAIAAYAAAATLARSADAGAIVGVVLIATSSPRDSALAGLFAAALTAPHVAGPFAALLLDRSNRPRTVLAVAFLIYGIGVTSAALLLAGGWAIASILALIAAGACGPLLTGGLSSRLGSLVGDDQVAQRRAHGMDALSYGLAATCGPGAVALLATAISPLASVIVIAVFPAVAAVLLVAIPPAADARTTEARPGAPSSVRRNVAVLFTTGPLRRVTVGTSITAFAAGAIPLLAVASAVRYNGNGSSAAVLVSAFGIGNLAGSLAFTIRPLIGSPVRAVAWAALGVAGCLALCTVAPNLLLSAVAFGMAGGASAIQFTSSLAARSEFSSPGARAQVFVTMAGLKVACSSIGAVIAGTFASSAPTLLLSAAAAVAAAASAVMLLDATISRKRGSGRTEQPTPATQAGNIGQVAMANRPPRLTR